MRSGMASPKIGWVEMFNFTRATVYFLRYLLLKHKMTRYSKNSWLHGYACLRAVCITYIYCKCFM